LPTIGEDSVDINDTFRKEEKRCLGVFQVDDGDDDDDDGILDSDVCFICKWLVILRRPSTTTDDIDIQNTTA